MYLGTWICESVSVQYVCECVHMCGVCLCMHAHEPERVPIRVSDQILPSGGAI